LSVSTTELRGSNLGTTPRKMKIKGNGTLVAFMRKNSEKIFQGVRANYGNVDQLSHNSYILLISSHESVDPAPVQMFKSLSDP
jgi:hypothetical protein